MKGSEIVSMCRQDYLADTQIPYLWSDTFLLFLANEAEREAATRARLILDTTHATAEDVSGTATSTTAGKLVDAAAAFASMTGKTVYNTTKNTFTTVTATDSVSTLSLAADIMTSGDSYIVGDAAKSLTRICAISGTSRYPMSDKVIKIKECYRASDGYKLEQKTEGVLDSDWYQWRLAVGSPIYYIEKKGAIILVPTPDATMNSNTGKETLILETYRRPLANFTMSGSSSPEIPEHFHLSLIDGMCEMAYTKQDADTLNLQKSIAHGNKFTAKFGPPVTAKTEEIVRALPANFKLSGARW